MEYTKISKPIARKMYRSGFTIALLPCKVSAAALNNPGWIQPIRINKAESEGENSFDRTVDRFQYYNCNAETGYYASYYVTKYDYDRK